MRSFLVILTFLMIGIIGCKPNGSVSEEKATLTIKLTDAPFPLDILESAIVNITKIDMLQDGEFKNLITQNMSYNLLNLRGGVTETLTQIEVEPGEISQLRLFVEDATVTLKDGRTFDLKIPSGSTSGLKLMLDPAIKVVTGQLSYELTLDFDISKSFKPQGNANSANGITGFIFSPVIRVANNTTHGRVSGNVLSNNCSENIFDATPLDLISVEAIQGDVSVATAGTGEDGKFILIGLEEGNYDLKIEDAQHDIYTTNIDIFAGNETTTGEIVLSKKCVSVLGAVTSDNGTLDDSDDFLLESVNVDLVDAQGNVIDSILTDINGEFSFSSTPVGSYEVIFSDIDHEEQSILIDQTMEGPQEYDILMNAILTPTE